MHEILNTRIWSFDSGFFATMAPIVLKRLANGGNLDALQVQDPEKKEYAASISWDPVAKLPVFNAGEEQSVAIIEVVGSMTKRGGACSFGTKQLSAMLARANAANHVAGTVILMDSPGGAVDGLPEFATIIKNSSKPTAGFIDGMACSAMYWSGSQTNWLVANQYNYATIGSIGTLCMRIDQTKWLEKEGLKVTIHRADQSTDKATLNPYEEAPEAEVKALEDELTAITEDFIAAVKDGRGDRLKTGKENIFTGKTYSKEDALSMGMIDAIGTLQDAVNKVLELASAKESQASKTTTKQANNKQSDMKADKIFAILGLAKKDVESKLSAEQVTALDAAEDKLAEIEASNQKTVSDLQQQIDALTADKDQLQATIDEQTKTIEAKDDKIALLESDGESAKGKGAQKEGDSNAGYSKADRKVYSWEAKAQKKSQSFK